MWGGGNHESPSEGKEFKNAGAYYENEIVWLATEWAVYSLVSNSMMLGILY